MVKAVYDAAVVDAAVDAAAVATVPAASNSVGRRGKMILGH